MKKVLIAIDYNPVSEKVVKEGYELAKTLGAEICLVHVLDDLGYYTTNYPTFLGYEGYPGIGPDYNVAIEMRTIAEDFIKKAADHLDDPQVKTEIIEGDTAKALLNFSEEWKADVLVMGTHSHSVLEKLLMGTVAEKVLEKTRIPVYVVPVKQ
ncbi:universal stress protein [Salinimicrobium soli]|uniref:universal stress protein n=1 Tax=Salinimicrobium soli TaxID=1254399 RepID=UPI003AADFB7C